jgi:starch-binding outer membrane protein, SusD/RagB family
MKRISKMKNIFKILGFTAMTAVVLVACKDNFLEKPAQGNLDAVTLNNQAGVEGSLIAAYSMLDGWGNYGGWGGAASNWIFGSVASDDAYKGSEPGDQQGVQDVELYQWATGAADEYLNDKWGVSYDGINRANATLTLLKQVFENGNISASDADRVEGEALVLRAHYHFEAWKMWKNIPYYTESDTDFKKTNLGTDAIPLILADLNAAIAKLPESQAQVGRVTRWTAKALKGRVQVYSGDYAGGLTTLKEVVTSGPYDLEENFHDAFSVAKNNGSETILAYQASVNDGNPNGENGNRQDRLNFPHAGSEPAFGCCGFHQPSQNLVNAFKVDASGLPFLDGSFNNTDYVTGVAGDAVDPRLDWTVGRDNVPYLDWGLHLPGWIRDRVWAGPYSPKKNIYEKSSSAGSAVGWASYQLNSLNLHLLRYADVLLLLAEAEIQAGSIVEGIKLINQIRARAGEGAQGPDGGSVVVPIDDPAITWANYKIGLYPETGWTKDEAMKALKMERRLELAMEGHRFFDLRRWGDAQTVINDYLTKEKTRRNYLTAATAYADRHNLYPLPTFQIELSTISAEGGGEEKRLVQNTGW